MQRSPLHHKRYELQAGSFATILTILYKAAESLRMLVPDWYKQEKTPSGCTGGPLLHPVVAG
jgi:hypothetical protein